MNRAGRRFLAHLLHRRCRYCYEAGQANGFYQAAMLQEGKDGLLRQGYSEQEAEALLRIRLEAR